MVPKSRYHIYLIHICAYTAHVEVREQCQALMVLASLYGCSITYTRLSDVNFQEFSHLCSHLLTGTLGLQTLMLYIQLLSGFCGFFLSTCTASAIISHHHHHHHPQSSTIFLIIKIYTNTKLLSWCRTDHWQYHVILKHFIFQLFRLGTFNLFQQHNVFSLRKPCNKQNKLLMNSN